MDAYDRQGNPITTETWGKLHADYNYRVVALDDVSNDDGNWSISTVWLGLDHGYGDNSGPVIFETMIFEEGVHDCYCERYETEEEAKDSHEFIVEMVRNGFLPQREDENEY